MWQSRQSLSKTRWKSFMGDVRPLPTAPAKWSEQHKRNMDRFTVLRMNMVHTVSIHHYPKKFWMVAIISFFHFFYIYIYIHHLTQRGKFGEAFRWTTMILPGHSEAWVISVQRTPDVLQFLCPTKCRPKKLDSLFTLCVVAASPQKDTCFWWAPDIRWCIFLSMHCVVTNFWIP